ncbi:MAG TPA: adenylate/guanylate cyclase domain-containing protein, partial [Tepidisphaeraceae bacterium]|nr:adenylate/guanylate cyclase domain-containing protein [Tepidisphaeraceae bacterium]
MENQLYDARARYCQQFVGPPTRKLIHLDIDDASLESIGRWPWPRSVLAEILDELRRADAKVVALDIILPDPQAPTYLPDGRGMIDNDAILAASIQKFGRVLVPVSFHFGRFTPQSSMERAIANQLQSSIRISFDTIKSSLDNRYPHITVDDYLPVLRNVVYDRIAAEMHRHQGTLEEIEKRLIGSDTTNINPLIPATIRVQYRIYESERAIERLGKSVDQPMPDVLRPLSALVMIPPLARAAAYTAFVDHLPHGDGVERSVPLWVLFNGRLYPQMGLALACATLGVPLDRLKISDSSLTIPLSDGKAIVIPTHSFYSKRLERRVGYLMDIPWFGTSDWTTMYDYPNHLKAEQHMPIGKVWELSQARRVAHQNNLQADKALKYLGDKWGLDDVNAFLAHRPDPEIIDSRIAIAKKALAESDDWARPLENEKRANLKPDEADFLDARSDLRTIIGNNQPIAALATQIKQSLRGKCILIGSIATSAFDFVTTPLHAQCPGVVVHGAIFNAIMQQHLLRTAPFADTAAAIVGVGVLATFAVTILSPWMALLATLLLLGGYAAINGFFLFAYEGTIVGAAGPLVAGALVWGGVTLMRYITEITERTRITRRFRAYADQKLVDYVLAHPEQNVFDGEEREMTCVFTDMQGYTSLVERLGKGVVPALNEYMGRMAAIIQEQGGYLNKFLGDGIMFFYGAPEHDPHHAQRAVRTVMEMRESGIPAFNQWLSEQGLDLHVSVRAGVT